MSDFAALYWLYVLAVVADADAGEYGADYVGAGDAYAGGLLDYVIEGGADVAAANDGEAGGFDVAVEGGEAAEAVFVDDCVWADPGEVGFLDLLAIRVVADGAFSGVALGRLLEEVVWGFRVAGFGG